MITYQTIDIRMPAIARREVTRWVRAVAATYGKTVGDVAYIFCDDEKILEVNRQYIQHDYYTDIITFDYTEGVFRMKHKFQALYGCSILPPFERAGLPVRFLHDSTSYILGEVSDGTLQGTQNPCCVMLGTGLGFSMMKDGKVLIDQTQTPALALWCAPFREGIAEDYVSTRAIQAAYGQPLSVKDIAGRARQGDEQALRAFRLVGEALSELMEIIDRRFHPDKLALGGQIARSADLLQLKLPFPWEVSHHLDDAALRGAAYYALRTREECTEVLPKISL